MSKNNNIYEKSLSDSAIMANIGAYIKHHRLEQNKTQQELATAAGINRATLVLFEHGKGGSITMLIQLLRSLNLLHVLNVFEVKQEISPLLLAEIDMAKRMRASRQRKARKKPKSDW